MNPLRRAGRWVRERELAVLLALLVVVLGVWLFAALAGEVLEGDTQAFDAWALRSLRTASDPAQPVGPAWLAPMARDVTALGGWAVLGLVTVGVVGFLALGRQPRAAWVVIGAVLSGVALSQVVKALVARPRPTVVPHLTAVASASFPSGHSMLSAVVYLTLGTLAAGLLRRRAQRLWVLGTALVLTFLVGLSRVYLGVHYPTDVLGGWTGGLAWAALWWLLARRLQGSTPADNGMREAVLPRPRGTRISRR